MGSLEVGIGGSAPVSSEVKPIGSGRDLAALKLPESNAHLFNLEALGTANEVKEIEGILRGTGTQLFQAADEKKISLAAAELIDELRKTGGDRYAANPELYPVLTELLSGVLTEHFGSDESTAAFRQR